MGNNIYTFLLVYDNRDTKIVTASSAWEAIDFNDSVLSVLKLDYA